MSSSMQPGQLQPAAASPQPSNPTQQSWKRTSSTPLQGSGVASTQALVAASLFHNFKIQVPPRMVIELSNPEGGQSPELPAHPQIVDLHIVFHQHSEFDVKSHVRRANEAFLLAKSWTQRAAHIRHLTGQPQAAAAGAAAAQSTHALIRPLPLAPAIKPLPMVKEGEEGAVELGPLTATMTSNSKSTWLQIAAEHASQLEILHNIAKQHPTGLKSVLWQKCEAAREDRMCLGWHVMAKDKADQEAADAASTLLLMAEQQSPQEPAADSAAGSSVAADSQPPPLDETTAMATAAALPGRTITTAAGGISSSSVNGRGTTTALSGKANMQDPKKRTAGQGLADVSSSRIDDSHRSPKTPKQGDAVAASPGSGCRQAYWAPGTGSAAGNVTGFSFSAAPHQPLMLLQQPTNGGGRMLAHQLQQEQQQQLGLQPGFLLLCQHPASGQTPVYGIMMRGAAMGGMCATSPAGGAAGAAAAAAQSPVLHQPGRLGATRQPATVAAGTGRDGPPAQPGSRQQAVAATAAGYQAGHPVVGGGSSALPAVAPQHAHSRGVSSLLALAKLDEPAQGGC